MTALLGLDPATYQPHPVHDLGALYPLTNCWADVVIELLHAHGHEPLACLGAALSVDHEGDQFTFFKPRPGDLERLYGVDIHEMQPYRDLRGQVKQQLELGRTVIVETDAWWLPDTAGDSYRREHVKTSVAVEALDEQAQELVYFHNGGLYRLGGEDFAHVLSGRLPRDGAALPAVRRGGAVRPRAAARRGGASGGGARAAPRHLARRPLRDPYVSFLAQVERELPALPELDETEVHGLAFATTRMAGAAAVLAAAHVRWLLAAAGEPAALALDQVAAASRTLTVRLARRRAFDPAPLVTGMGAQWAEALERLDELAA